MDIKIWVAIDAAIFGIGLSMLGWVAPHTILAFVPEEAWLLPMWITVGILAVGVGLAYELWSYVRTYGLD